MARKRRCVLAFIHTIWRVRRIVGQIGADALAPDQKANFYRYPVKLTLDKPYLEHKGVKVPLAAAWLLLQI